MAAAFPRAVKANAPSFSLHFVGLAGSVRLVVGVLLIHIISVLFPKPFPFFPIVFFSSPSSISSSTPTGCETQ